MVIKVGINGFGRVGRVVFRTCLERSDVEVCAINDPAIDINYICYLIKFDSTHGTLRRNISHLDNEILIDDVRIKVFQEKFPTGIPWDAAGAEYIVEASGMFTSLDKAAGHLVSDYVKRVIVTAPCADVPMVIFGVNEKTIKPSTKVISCGSSTLYCLAPIIKILEDNYGVEDGFITSIHAMTPSLKPLDGLCLKGKHWRDHRSITQNIIPAATGACKALGRIIPAVKDRMCGLAFRVPIANVSVMDLSVRLKKFTSIENIVRNIKQFNETTKNIIKTNSEESVSSDFIGDSYSCILDISSSIELKPNAFKLICWYENEYSYACRVIDLINFSEYQYIELHRIPTRGTVLQAQNESPARSQKDLKAITKTAKNRPSLSFKNQIDRKANENSILWLNPQNRLMCKIWNDEDGSVKHSRPSAFFQPCARAPRHPRAPAPDPAARHQAQERDVIIRQDAICSKAQERLEKVKIEFSKMVSITETLLKKSHNSLKTLGDSNETMDKRKQEEKSSRISIIKAADSFTISNDVTNSLMSTSTYIVDHSTENTVSGNGKSDMSILSAQSVKFKDTVKMEDQTGGNKSFVTNTFTEIFEGISELQRQFSSCKANVEENEVFNTHYTKIEDLHVPNENMHRADQLAETQITQTYTEQEQLEDSVAKKIDNFKDINVFSNKEVKKSETHPQNDTQNEPEHKQCDETNKEDTKERCSNNFRTKASDISEHDDDIKISNACKSGDVSKHGDVQLEINTFENGDVSKDGDEQKKSVGRDGDVHLEENDLTKRDDIQIEDNASKENDLTKRDDIQIEDNACRGVDVNKHGDEHLEENDVTNVNDIQIEDNTCKDGDVNKYGDVHLEENACTEVPMSWVEPGDASWMSSPLCTDKEDIYDILDSDSGSEHSFSTEKKKSKIIKICDITNSLEDLDRLDKICKIMEISDELSDRLFSTLNKNSGETNENLAKKKWSFKDLCEKVNLDEFCNTVFGK